MTRRDYLPARSRIALTGLILIAAGWLAVDALATGGSENRQRLGGALFAAGNLGGLLWILVGNLLVRRRCRSRGDDETQ